MASNVTLDPWSMDSPLSTITTPSHGGDSPGANNDRIFFGPVQSPEKKYALPSGAPRFRTPVRRSTRLSAGMVPLPLFPEDSVEGTPDAREETPEEDAIPDEPSVILASRVLSACSNPSPPPTPPLPAQQEPSDTEDIQPFHMSHTTQAHGAGFDTPTGPLPVEHLSASVMASSPFVPRSSTPNPTDVDDQANVSQPDLITFDSLSTSDATHTVALPGVTSLRLIQVDPPPLVPSSVDDLLSMSPHPSSDLVTKEQEQQADEHDTPSEDSTATPDEEMEIVNSLLITTDPPVVSSPVIDIALPEEEVAPASAPLVVEHLAQEEQTPPLRRSTRPRKSRSSLPQTIIDTSPQPTLPRKEGGEANPDIVATKPDEATESPQRKRKLNITPVSEDKGEGCSTGASITPRRLPQVARVHRELGSLSPMSAGVLMQLLPKAISESTSGSSTPQPPLPLQSGDTQTAAEIVIAPAPATPPHQTTAFVFPKVGQADIPGDAPRSRPKSPLRPFSPSKFAEGSRTPARRVPIAQAITEGTYSVQKLPAAFANPPISPVFKKLALDDPSRSPARRVPMTEAVPIPPPSPGKGTGKDTGKAIVRSQSPIRASSVPRERERSVSVEPQPVFGRRERGASVEPTVRQPALGRRPLFQKPASSDGVLPSGMKSRTVLPFPITQRLHPSIPEAEEPGASVARPVGTSAGANRAVQASPGKPGSSLRQPSVGAGSKIPRIGAKPYARPKAADAVPSKLPTPAKPRIVIRAKPLRVVNVGSSSGSSSDEGQSTVPLPAPALQPRQVASAQLSSSSTSKESGPSQGLKRKREQDVPKAKASASGVKPVIMMRKVVPGMFNKGKEVAAPPSRNVASAAGQVAVPPSPAKPLGPIKARSAVGWKRPQPEGQPPPVEAAAPAKVEGLLLKERSPGLAPPAVSVESQPEPPREPPQATLPPAPLPVPPVTPSEPLGLFPVSTAIQAAESTGEPTIASHSHRRSTRSKRSPPATDVFGSVLPTATTRPPQARRRGPLPSETAGPFAGMSALALKTLTSANTLRNQQQVATIQTEVIRKEGSRPESPTTRVRSALEKQKEERIQQRQQRAERRARRSAGSDLDVSLGPGESESAVEQGEDEVNGAGDASFVSVEQDGVPGRHRRGPGDEEDYETPQRPERPTKRGRFEEGVEKESDADVPEKRVKWDRGLHTTVYLDDTAPKPKWNTKAMPSTKSCLTPAAKALRLDTLGNVVNAELPIGGLVKESIVVKKFVFDDDVQTEGQSPAPPPAPPAVKSTRSKSKKAKS